MKKLLILLLFVLAAFYSFSQPYDPSKVNKKAQQLYAQAMERAQDGNLTHAVGLLQQCIQVEKNYVDAYLLLAAVYSQLRNNKNSIENYERAFAIDSNYSIDYKLSYSIQLAATGQFEKALDAVNDLLTKKPPKNENSLKACEYRKRCYEFAINYAREHAGSNYVFEPKNLGPGVNTAESEYFPSLSIDGKELVFTRKLKGYNEDFFYSHFDNNDWQTAKAMEGDVNTPDNEAAQNISQDGQWMVFTADNRRGGFGDFDIYISYFTSKGWSQAYNLGRKVNSDQWDSQPCLSPDKRDLYFASRRFGGYGGSDIYVSHLQANGEWGTPENLGPNINTAADEQCPFIHADNQTLYFTSPFWQGYGDDDIFYVRKTGDGAWTKPVNLGYPINTINKEGTLFIAADGKNAYYASDRSDSRGGTDIYNFELREDVRPFKTLWVKGQVYDKKTREGLPSVVELVDLSTKQLMSKVQTDETGNYLVTLPIGKNYAFNVNRKGYLFYSGSYFLSTQQADSSYEKNIALQPIEVNAAIVLNNIFFDVNKYELKPESQVELDIVVQLLKDNPTVKIEIEGHTDNAGKPADNLLLSNNRAKAVVAYLVSRGIAQQRLVAKGYGESKPAADNSTEEGKARNRRTELRVISK